MRKSIVLTALAALVAAPLLMSPSDANASCRGRKIASTALGSGVGALVGNAVSGGGGGAVIGAVGGGVVGHEIGRSGCAKTRTYTRASRARYVAAPTAASAPRPARKVYYDEYGNPVAAAPVVNR